MTKPLRGLADEGEPPLGGVLDFMRLLWAVDHELQAASKRMLARIGVTGPQRLALRIIGRFPGISAGRLARILHVHPSTLSGVLQRIEERRLVERWSDPRDARRALFGLTGAGRTIDREPLGTVEVALSRALAEVPAQKLEVVREVLDQIVATLRAAGAEGAPN